MNRLIIITLVLLAATAMITVTYFKNLNPPGRRTSQVINTIPNTAALIFEFNNDERFFEMYDSSALFSSIAGRQQMMELNTLKKILLRNTAIQPAFAGQNVYISVHPQANNELDLLLTLPLSADSELETGKSLTDSTLTIAPLTIAGKPGFQINIKELGKNFYLVDKGQHVFTGSFSKTLVEQSAAYKPGKATTDFKLLSDQQAANSLGNLYINYRQLTPLLGQLFKESNPDIAKTLRMLPATATLSLNYKNDALMFNGYTTLHEKQATCYVSLFKQFKPVTNNLKNIFPATTAYSQAFAVDNAAKFTHVLADWHAKVGLGPEKKALFKRIKAETGIQFNTEFNKLLGHEFAVITTRFEERLAIIEVTNGSQLRPFMANISTMVNDEYGQLNYDKIPFYMLGDAFSPFRRPYFLILDNYLVLANSPLEISNFKDNYLSSRFLSKTDAYNEFNNLLSQQCNVAFYVNFKNATPVFKQHLKTASYKSYQQEPGLNRYYGASYQLTGDENEFYTNFCMKIDTTAKK